MADLSENPVDLSSLDPARDPARWDRIVAATAARARARRSLSREVVRRGVPEFVLAAAAAAVIWLARPRAAPAPTRAPADVLATWAMDGGEIDPRELLLAGGGS
jgi:hypothetical protein